MLRQFAASVADVKATNRAAAELVGERAAELVPVRSGLLRSTIRAAGQKAGAVVRAGTGSVPYAAPIHFGWPGRNIAPAPFLYDALDDRRAEVLAVYQSRVAELIKKYDLD